MKAALTLMLIVIIIVFLTAILVAWTVMNTLGFFEMNEINAVKNEFEECNDKIIETARTGLSNRCIFSANKGELTGSNDGLHYKIVSREKVCDEHDWVLIDEEKHIWQKCDVSGRENIFELKWNFPSQIEIEGQNLNGSVIVEASPVREIIFSDPTDFVTLSLFVQFELGEEEGVEILSETGNIVEISRVSMTNEKITLRINMR
ncbi:MAG: hypothetical protein ACFFDS_06845 [Candidatus Thorarchaeota archaeon]